MKRKSDFIDFLEKNAAWKNNDNAIWLASTVKMYRNIANFKFPGKLTVENKKQILPLIENGLIDQCHLQNPFVILAEDMTPIEKEYLYEHFLAVSSFQQAHGGEAFITDETGKFLVIINVRDHIQLQLTYYNNEIEEAWGELVATETKLGSSIDYSFSPKFGFLSSDFSTCGTGLVVYIFLHVPALVHTNKLNDILLGTSDDDEEVVTEGIQGNLQQMVGDVLTLHNSCTLGLTENDIIRMIHTSATRLMVAEKSARTKLCNENNPDIKDKISRAFGLLTHSYCLETKEALDALSLCKLGSELGWVTGVPHAVFNDLFFTIRRAHLMQKEDSNDEQDTLTHKRAEYIHTSLQEAKLALEV
jgi:protein arginine kinase